MMHGLVDPECPGLTDVIGQEHDKERCDKIIDPLNIAASRVPHGPDKQDSLKTLLHNLLLKKLNLRVHSWDINRNLKCRENILYKGWVE